MRKLAVLASITLGGTGVTTLAEPQAVTGDALRLLAAGKTVHLESPYGTLPVTFKEDGTLAAKASAGLALYLGSTADRGRWTVQGDRICQKFFRWFHGETHCMRVGQDGRKITWRRDDGLSGTAVIAANNAAPPERPVGLGVKPADLAMVAKPETEAKPELEMKRELKAAPAVVAAMAAPAVQPKVETAAPKPETTPARQVVANVAERAVASELEQQQQVDERRITAQVAPPPVAEPRLPEQRIAPTIVPPRPVLASLHGLPPGLLGRPIAGRAERAAMQAQEPAAEAISLVPAAKITARETVDELLQQRAAHLWCEPSADVGAASGTQAGQTRPYIFEAVPDLASSVETHALGAGCLMPSVALSEIARTGLFGR